MTCFLIGNLQKLLNAEGNRPADLTVAIQKAEPCSLTLMVLLRAEFTLISYCPRTYSSPRSHCAKEKPPCDLSSVLDDGFSGSCRGLGPLQRMHLECRLRVIGLT